MSCLTLNTDPLRVLVWAAPELHITVGGTHVVYFVTNSLSTGKLVVGVGVSTAGVAGPYKDPRGGPILTTSTHDCFGVIGGCLRPQALPLCAGASRPMCECQAVVMVCCSDPNYFLDPATGTQYISYKVGCPHPSHPPLAHSCTALAVLSFHGFSMNWVQWSAWYRAHP